MANRNKNGQFTKGHSGGPGRPKKEESERIYRIALESVSDTDLVTIFKKQVAAAKKGNLPAANFIFDRLFGKPMQRVESDISAEIGLMEESIKIYIPQNGRKDTNNE